MGKTGNQTKNLDTTNSRTRKIIKVYHRKKRRIRETEDKVTQKETGKEKGKQGMVM